MPYIKPDERGRLNIDKLPDPTNAGELNYLISKLLDRYLLKKPKVRYADINEVVGVLECAKLEFYRRVASPYEDMKREENGEVYTAHK